MVEEAKNNIIKLTLLYFAAHWLLLVITGHWIDDWCVYDQPINIIMKLFTEAGAIFAVPSYIINDFLPADGYKKILFFLYYTNVLCLYKTLRNWLKCAHNTCFWICALYSVIPCNDARMMLILFDYGIALCCFMLGLCLLSELFFIRTFSVIGRICTLFLFLYSFFLPSLLILYSLVLLMILTKEKTLKSAWKYIDFILLPIVYWIFKNVCFPAQGAYEGYNAISILGIIKATVLIIPADIIMLAHLLKNCALFSVIPLVMALLIYKYIKNSPKEELVLKGLEKIKLERKKIQLLLLGIWALSTGLYAYVVVRGGTSIATSDFQGRDSILAPMGAAIIFYILIAKFFKDKYKKIILISMIISGVCYFNFYYLAYQRDYYKNVGFQYQLAKYPELKNLSTMVCLDSTSEVLSTSRFYTWNINARNVYGDQTRFIMNGKGDLVYLNEQKKWLKIFIDRPTYGMSQYNDEDTSVKCVLSYKFIGSYLDTIHLMTYGSTQKVYDSMGDYSKLDIYYPGSDMYNSTITSWAHRER